MSHRAAIYTVRVRPRRRSDEWALLGDYDGKGTWLGEVVSAVLGALDVTRADDQEFVRFETYLPGLDAHQVGAALISGERGIRSVLEHPTLGEFERTEDHAEGLRSAVLFDLPPDADVGMFVAHVPHGRSGKTLVERALRSRLGGDGHFVEMAPLVPTDALRRAAENDALHRVTLTSADPAGAGFADVERWSRDGSAGVSLTVASSRGSRLDPTPLSRFLDSPTAANRRAILELGGLRFDDAAFTVELPSGSRRTYHLEPRPGGHPLTISIEPDDTDRLGATVESIARELRRAIAEAATV